MNNKIQTLLIILSLSFFIGGCSVEEPSPAPTFRPKPFKKIEFPALPEKPVFPKYVYRGILARDPFIALTGAGMSFAGTDEILIPNLDSLYLKGIFVSNGKKIALLSAGSKSYTLRGTIFYDSRNRLIKGMTGAIKRESVIMIAPDKKSREIPLREKKK